MSKSNHIHLLRYGRLAIQSNAILAHIKRVEGFHTTCDKFSEKNSQKTSSYQEEYSHSFNRSSSSSYQDFHRKRYERKRTFYEQERQKTSNSNQANVSYSTGPNHYERLNLSPSANSSEVKSAYYGLSKQYHPDVAGENNDYAAEQFRLITESYDILSDPGSRKDYDRTLNLTSKIDPGDTWSPKSKNLDNDINFNAIYRMRQADQIFRNKQEEAFEREKRLNPQKFRAGNFTNVEQFSEERFQSLERRLSELERQYVQKPNVSDHGHFYRIHLFDVMHRKRDAMDAIRNQRNSNNVQLNDEFMNFLPVIFVVTIGAIVLAGYKMIFSEVDLAATLDTLISTKKVRDPLGKPDGQ